MSLSGAGADATNTILTKTRAFTLDSNLKSAGDVHVTATGAASIEALVIGFSAAIALGAGAVAVSIGISLAQNLIGWNPAAYDASSDADGRRAPHRHARPGRHRSLAGNIYKYVGSTLTGSVNLRVQNYDAALASGSC